MCSFFTNYNGNNSRIFSAKCIKVSFLSFLSFVLTKGITFILSRQLLGFGKVSHYLGYNALKDFFPNDGMKPNPECSNSFCIKQQKAYQERLKKQPKKDEEVKVEKKITHEDNSWGITVVSTSNETGNKPKKESIPIGTKREYEVEKIQVRSF